MRATPGSFRVLCHQFRRDPDPAFFAPSAPSSRTSKSRDLVVALRKRNYSIYEISEALKERRIELSPSGVRKVLEAEGFAPLPRRLDEERPDRVHPTIEPVANVHSFSMTPRSFTTRCGGLFLLLPDLVRLPIDRLTPAPRNTRFRLLACFAGRGFHPAGFHRKVSAHRILLAQASPGALEIQASETAKLGI